MSNKDILPFVENGWNIVESKNDVIIMKENKFKYIRRNEIK